MPTVCDNTKLSWPFFYMNKRNFGLQMKKLSSSSTPVPASGPRERLVPGLSRATSERQKQETMEPRSSGVPRAESTVHCGARAPPRRSMTVLESAGSCCGSWAG